MTITRNSPTDAAGDPLVGLASQDRRVARELAFAERERQASVQRRQDEDAAAQRRLAEQDAALQRQLSKQEGRLRLDEQREQVKAARAERRREERERNRADRRARRQASREARTAWLQARVAYARHNAAAVYSSVIYGLAVAGAVYGQIDAARLHHIPLPAAIVTAAAIEGTGLAMALTAQQQRLRGERALAARALVWIATGAAVGINYAGHQSDWVKAVGLSALSAIGIVVFEIRSGAKHRLTLRKLQMIPEPGERFGLARWLAYPSETFAAWRLGIRDRLSPGAAQLIARVEQHRAVRWRQAEQAAEAARRQRLIDEVATQARKAARTAAKKGDAGAALAALTRLAHTGTPAPMLALASPARAEAEAARRAQAEAEATAAEAQRRAEAEATARAEAEATATTVRAEAEALRVALAQAEATTTDSGRRLRAEATARAQAEAAAQDALDRAEAEAARAHRSEGALRIAEQTATTARQQLDRTQAELVRAASARAEAEATLRAEAEAAIAAAQAEAEAARRAQAEAEATAAEALRRAEAEATARAEAEATAAARAEALTGGAARRKQNKSSGGKHATRRSSTRAVGEPVLVDGRPVPVVDRTSTATVVRVLTARAANPEATQQELAEKVGVSARTVRAVLAAAAAEQSDATEVFAA